MHRDTSNLKMSKNNEEFSKAEILKKTFRDFERISKENVPLQQKIDKLNLEMLRILRGSTN